MKRFRWVFCLFTLVIAGVSFPSSASGQSSGASIVTDQSDYAPHDTVWINGSGFWSGETVQLQVAVAGSTVKGLPAQWTTTAGEDGGFTTLWVVTSDAVNQTLELTAYGESSGELASTIFTDLNSVLSFYNLPETVVPGGMFTVTAELEQNCGGGTFNGLAGREVLFFFNPGDCGVDPGQEADTVVLTDANGFATAKFVSFDTGRHSVRIKYLGELKPGAEEAPNSACNPSEKVTISASNECKSLEIVESRPVIACGTVSRLLCDPDTICVPFMVYDTGAGGLTFRVLYPDGATVDELSGEVCFQADTAGSYFIAIEGTDIGGQKDTGLGLATVTMNEAPTCYLPGDTSISLCQPEEICLPIFSFDPDGGAICTIVSGPGSLGTGPVTSGKDFRSAKAGTPPITWCWVPEGDTTVTVTIRCEDTCGAFCEESFVVTVDVNEAPTCGLPTDTSIYLCDIAGISIPINSTDPDGDVLSCTLTAGPGSIENGVWSYTPTGNETVTFTVRCTDTCGSFCESTTDVHININEPPVCNLPGDTTITICDLSEVIIGLESPGCTLIAGPGQLVEGVWRYTPTGDNDTVLVTVECFDECGVYCGGTFRVVFDLIDSPACVVPNDTAITFCGETQITLPVSASGCTVVSGPGEIIAGNWVYTVIAEETVTVTIRCEDACGVFCEGTFTVDFSVVEPPVCLVPNDTLIGQCEPTEVRLPVSAIGCSVTEGPGTIVNGEWVYTPSGSEQVSVTISCWDECSTYCEGTFNVTFDVNSAPVVSLPADTTLYLCSPDSLCIPVSVTDFDENIVDVQIYGLENYNGVYSSGQVCFVPYDSGRYEFSVVATDDCGLVSADTIVITIDTDQDIQIICPNDTSIFACKLDTFAFPIEIVGIPDGTTVTSSGINTWLSPSWDTVYFSAECALSNLITIRAFSPCDTFQCQFTVVVECNTAPLVFMPNDTAISICQPGDICLPVGVSDPDNNIVSVISIAEGQYSALSNSVCFTADQSGVYSLSVVATDECGLSDTDQVTVTVTLDEAPPCVIPADTSVFLCAPDTIRIPLASTNCTVTSGPGQIVNGIWIYEAATDETFQVSIQCDNSCGEPCTGTFAVTVDINDSPACQLPTDTTIFLCGLNEVRLPVTSTGCSVVSGPGSIVNGEWVYTPSGDETITVTIECTDVCGVYCQGNFTVTFDLNEAPICLIPNDTTVFQCAPTEICLPVSATDGDGNLITDGCTVVSGPGQIANGQWCYTPSGAETFTVVVSCFDACEESCIDSFTVTVDIPEAPACVIPNDTTITLCELAEVILPVSASGCSVISGPGAIVDGNWVYTPAGDETATVTVQCVNECGVYCEGTFVVTFDLVEPPVCVLPSDTLITLCGPIEVQLPVSATGCVVTSGPGQIVNGNWVYTPQADEVATVTIQCTDQCGVYCEGTFAVTFDIIDAPICDIPNDTAVFQCAPTEIAIPVTSPGCAVVSGPGAIVSGFWVYTPQSSEFATVTISCTNECGVYCEGTFTVNITLNEAPVCNLPGDTTVTLCQPTEICLPISGGSGPGKIDDLYCELISGPGSMLDGNWCYTPSGDETFTLVFDCFDECGASCRDSFTVTVDIVDPGFCQAPNDTSMRVSDAGTTVCLPGFVCGWEGCTVSFGTLSGDTLCFPVDTAGLYTLVISGSDTCGNSSACTTFVSMSIGAPPFCNLPGDTTLLICDLSEVCLPLVTEGSNPNVSCEVTSGPGQIVNNQWCYTPTGSEQVTVSVRCTDTNGDFCDGQFTATFNLHESPSCVVPNDTTIFQCVPQLVSLPVASNDCQITSGPGAIVNGNWEYTPTSDETVTVTISCSDVCGVYCEATFAVSFDINEAPLCSAPNDTTISLCGPTEIRLPVGATDADGNLTGCFLVESPGEIVNGEWVYTPTSDEVVTVLVRCMDNCDEICEASFTVTIQIQQAPTCVIPNDTTLLLCAPDSIKLPVSAVGCEVLSGSGSIVNGEWVYYANQSIAETITIRCTNECGVYCEGSFDIDITVEEAPPCVLPNDTTIVLCSPAEVVLPVSSDLCAVTSGPGQIVNSNWVYTPQGDETATVIISCANNCGVFCEGTFVVIFDVNEAPIVSLPADTSLYLCQPDSICIPVSVIDGDENIVDIQSTGGVYANGEICFVPYDSGNYILTITATDDCGLTSTDTIVVRVLTDQGISIVCPGDTTIFTCELDTMCFPINGIPEAAQVTISGVNTWYDAAAGTICFYAECAVQNKITVNVTTGCSQFSCQFTVTVECNTPPLVFMPHDTAATICGSTDICVPVGISDVDDNVASIYAYDGQGNTLVYDPLLKQTCINVSMAGTYLIITQVFDDCEESAVDTTVLTVTTNSEPQISINLTDSVFQQCAPEEICLPIQISDVDGNFFDDVVTSIGNYNAQTGEVCFTPVQFGQTCVTIVATDVCGARDTVNVCVTVNGGDYVSIACPAEPITAPNLCEPSQVCVELPITGSNFQIATDLGTWVNDTLCFFADTSGLYAIEVTGQADCNSDTCVVLVNVHINEPLDIVCSPDVTMLLCGDTTICLPFTTSASVTQVTPSSAHTVTILDGNACIEVTGAGVYDVTLIGQGECGQVQCSFSLTAVYNSPPTIVSGPDTSVLSCDLETICIPVTTADIDGNIASVVSSHGTFANDTVCFTPNDFGAYTIVVTVTDACGEFALDTTQVNLVPGGTPSIVCPGNQTRTVCQPETICIVAPVSPASSQVTVSPIGTYDTEIGQVCIPVDTAGVYGITIVANAPCGVDSCTFNLTINRPPTTTLTCPGQIDTVLCLAQPATLCFPANVTGQNVQVSVSNGGTYSNGQVCVSIAQPGTQSFVITASGDCGTVTCTTTVVTTADQPPTLFVPANRTYEWCPDDGIEICIDSIFATDAESTPGLNMTCGPAGADFQLISADSGRVCWVPTTAGTVEFCFEAFDGCTMVRKSIFVTIQERPDCDVCVRLWMNSGECTPVGLAKNVDFMIETRREIGGFDLLINYDASGLSFNGVVRGTSTIKDWEYFTYQLGTAGCGSSCPSGLVRFIGIADNNATGTPPESAFMPSGVLFTVQFLVANNQNLGGFNLPVNFVWFDCGDNTVSDRSGNQLLVDSRIYTAGGFLLWDEDDDATFPELSRPVGMGAPDACIQSEVGKPTPLRCIEFENGEVCVVHPDSIDARGDVNLNLIPYEIADAVLFSRYFIYGLSVFVINVPGQIAATDVNADGLTLTVADLVQLIRVVTGDADPIPKIDPYSVDLVLTAARGDGSIRLSSDAVSSIGAVYLTYEIVGDVVIEDILASPDIEGMSVGYGIEDKQLRVLVYDLGTDRIGAGRNDLIEIRFAGTGQLRLARQEVVDYQGRPYKVATDGAILPDGFSLNQNYPNPFNPTTLITFDLPKESEWSLQVYTVKGSMIREYSGSSEAGTVSVEWNGADENGTKAASGVYFYRLKAGEFSDAKKMLLLK